MRKIDIKEIINHPDQKKSKELVSEINSKINGRICLTSYVHIIYLIRDILGEFCKTYMEIGVLHGGTIGLVAQSQYNTRMIGIDDFTFYGKKIDKSALCKGSCKVSLQNAKENIEKVNKNNYAFELIQGDSHSIDTFNKVKNICQKVEFLLIDGDHSKKGVIKDFQMYSPFVAKGGIIMFDNYGDPNWPQVKKGVQIINLKGWRVVGRYDYSLIIQRSE